MRRRLGGNKPLPDRLHAIVQNVRVGRRPRDVVLGLRKEMAGHAPHFLVLMEAGGYASALREGFPEYRILQATGWPEAGTTIIMVRRDMPLSRWTAARMRQRWVGPKLFLPHAPRTHLVADLGDPRVGHSIRIPGLHMPPGGPTGGTETNGRNAPAWAESYDWLVRLAARPGSHKRAFFAAGDLNATEHDRHRLSPWALAAAIGGDLVSTNAKVDKGISRDCEVTSKRGGMNGSDHPAIHYFITFTHARKAAA